MKSKVVELYDWKLIEIPEEMQLEPITDEEVEAQILALSKRNGRETEEQEVQIGDTVCLSCQEGSLLGRPVLVYPGLGLPGAKDAEAQVVSRAVGDCIAAEINGQSQKLTIERILRRSAAPVEDALAVNEQIEGVNTLADYRQWFRQKREAEELHNAAREVGFFMMEIMAERSRYEIDEEERMFWTLENAREEFEEDLEEGIDPRIPEEGFELLTDEEALEQIRQGYEEKFLQLLVCEAICQQQQLEHGPEEIDLLLAALDFIDERAEELLGK